MSRFFVKLFKRGKEGLEGNNFGVTNFGVKDVHKSCH